MSVMSLYGSFTIHTLNIEKCRSWYPATSQCRKSVSYPNMTIWVFHSNYMSFYPADRWSVNFQVAIRPVWPQSVILPPSD